MDEKHESEELKSVDLNSESSRESLMQQNQNEIVIKVSDLDSKPICRICYSGSSREKLLRPCKCKGTIEYVHRNCLERWLEAKNFETCELCNHRFNTRRTRKGCWEWLKQPEMQSERRNFIGDLTCFAFLTPLGIATFWLCAEAAIYYRSVKSSTLEKIALIVLAVFLVLAYFTWILLCTRYHYVMWSRWRNLNWNIRIVEHLPSDGNTDGRDMAIEIPNDTTASDEFLLSQQQLPKQASGRNTNIAAISSGIAHPSNSV